MSNFKDLIDNWCTDYHQAFLLNQIEDIIHDNCFAYYILDLIFLVDNLFVAAEDLSCEEIALRMPNKTDLSNREEILAAQLFSGRNA